jgi:hypothetical protein
MEYKWERIDLPPDMSAKALADFEREKIEAMHPNFYAQRAKWARHDCEKDEGDGWEQEHWHKFGTDSEGFLVHVHMRIEPRASGIIYECKRREAYGLPEGFGYRHVRVGGVTTKPEHYVELRGFLDVPKL